MIFPTSLGSILHNKSHIRMDDYIQLSTLNDFIFCPYSIYLHSVYMESDGDLYKAAPQTKGTLAHQGVDEKKSKLERKTSKNEE